MRTEANACSRVRHGEWRVSPSTPAKPPTSIRVQAARLPMVNATPSSPLQRLPHALWSSTGWQILGRLWAALTGLGGLAVLTRGDFGWQPLTGAEFGRLTFYLALYTLLDSLADFGTSSAVIQWGASAPGKLRAGIRAARPVRAFAALSGFVVVSLTAGLLGEEQLGWLALASLAPLSRCLEASALVFQNRLHWRPPVLVRGLVAGLRLAFFTLLISRGTLGFGPYLASYALLGALGNVLLYLCARAELAALVAPGEGLTRRSLLGLALPLAAVGLAQQAYFYGDNLVLRALVPAAQLGHYNAAVKLFSLSIMVAAFATGSALPWLARRQAAGHLGAATRHLVDALFPAACIGLGCLFPFRGELLGRLFGAEFESAGASLAWLLLAAAAVHLGAPLLTALVAARRSRSVLHIVLSGLLFNLVANLALVPSMQAPGAALATLGTELWVAVGALYALRQLHAGRLLRPLTLVAGALAFPCAALLAKALLG